MGCAQCHDHKYDPIRQKDFYQLYAFFDNAEEEDIDAPLPGETGLWLRKAAEFEQKREALIAQYKVREMQPAWEVDMLDAFKNPGRRTDWDLAWDCLLKLTEGGDGGKIIKIPAAQRTAREKRILETHFIRNYHFAIGQKAYKDIRFDELDKKLKDLEAAYPQLTQAYTLLESPNPQQSHLRIRGDFKQLGIPVEPDVNRILKTVSAPTFACACSNSAPAACAVNSGNIVAPGSGSLVQTSSASLGITASIALANCCPLAANTNPGVKVLKICFSLP